VFDVLIDGDRVLRVGRDLEIETGTAVVEIPAGFVVCPGLIDMHVHLREPGQEHKETVATGTAAAVAGGFTAVACMPNTSPVIDNAGVVTYVLKKAADANLARVYPIGAVSRGQQGEQLADIAEMKAAGCVALTDDGHPVSTAILMRRALEYAGMFNMPVIEHCEEQSLKGDGVAHEGFHASSLGLRGIPGEAESIMALRDISLAELTGGVVHVAHMSARQTLDAVRYGKSRGVCVTCEVTPHHFVLTDEMLGAPIPYDTNVKMNPPLREAAHLGTLLGAAALGKSYVALTLIGGGVFGNPVALIWESILWAVDTVRPLLHRDLVVVVNGRNLGQHIPAVVLREQSAIRGGRLVTFDRDSVTVD
jgi:dihydroorotase